MSRENLFEALAHLSEVDGFWTAVQSAKVDASYLEDIVDSLAHEAVSDARNAEQEAQALEIHNLASIRTDVETFVAKCAMGIAQESIDELLAAVPDARSAIAFACARLKERLPELEPQQRTQRAEDSASEENAYEELSDECT